MSFESDVKRGKEVAISKPCWSSGYQQSFAEVKNFFPGCPVRVPWLIGAERRLKNHRSFLQPRRGKNGSLPETCVTPAALRTSAVSSAEFAGWTTIRSI